MGLWIADRYGTSSEDSASSASPAKRSGSDPGGEPSSGFSLLELSIVLVIIGLLAGGVMTGKALIRGAEIRSTLNRFQTYRTAIYAYRDKYQALPGDHANACSFWPTTCVGNGTGNGAFDAWNEEGLRAWRHLANAGLVSGSYTGTNDAGGSTPGVNIPVGPMTNSGFSIFTRTGALPYDWPIFGRTGNLLLFGSVEGNGVYGPALSPPEAWQIDIKIDDGKADQGKVRPGSSTGNLCVSPHENQPSGSYIMTNSQGACHLHYFLD